MPYADKDKAKECFRTANKAWKERNKQRVKERDAAYYRKNRALHLARTRKRHLRRSYGITEEWYNETLAKQNGKCCICQKPPKNGRRLSVDHCHETGRVRGLLCPGCNSRVEKYQAYLRAHGG